MLIQTLVVFGTGIVVVLYTIETRKLRAAATAQSQIMQETLDLSKETARKQSDYLQRKEKKEEWRDAIRDADRVLEEHLNIVESGGGGLTDRRRLLQHVASEVLAAGKSYDAAYADTILAKYTKDVKVDYYRPTAALVCDIWELLDGFSENLTERDGRLLSFYVSYFQGVTTRLRTIGAINDHYFEKRLGKIIAKLIHKAAGWSVPAEADTNVGSGD